MNSVKEAEAIVGGLSKPSKMPGLAYGIPASACITGARLRKIQGSVCSKCYAFKGRYGFPNVQTAQQRRLQTLQDPRWVEAMAYLINKRGCEYFRWHDSGDLQSQHHLDMIIQVAELCPRTKFWLPTRELNIVRQNQTAVPENLVIRVSANLIDAPPPNGFPNTSTVVSLKADATCPAHRQGNNCVDCRSCWSRGCANIAYPRH